MNCIFFRIVQELISNSIRHEKATEYDVYITCNNNIFTFMYKDNGEHFNQEKKTLKEGLGMKNIEFRAVFY